MCRTCKREYNSDTGLCNGCYAADSPKHQGHEFARCMIQRVTDMPDDKDIQLSHWWRCNFPGCDLSTCYPHYRSPLRISLTVTVTGPSMEWLHKHAESRLCMGDALIDHCRNSASQQCLKTFPYRSRLTEPADPTKMKCNICFKGKPPVTTLTLFQALLKNTDASPLNPLAIAYGIWNHWCNTCDIAVCNTCVNTGRGAHRHSILWMRPVKVNMRGPWKIGNQKQCDRCGQAYFSNLFQGFECTGCREYHCCLPCVQKKIFPLHQICSGKQAAFDFLLNSA